MCHYFRISKFFMLERAMSRFSVGFFLSRSPKKLRRGTLRCFKKFLVSKIFMQKRGEEEERGSIKIFRQTFFVSVPKNL